jgi:macrolide-specific efflux system membrane fusion protein
MTAARWAAALVGVGAIGVAGWAFVDTPAAVSGADTTVPTERVARGALSLDVHLDGELRAAKSVSIAAPSVGGTLRILSMLETGTEVSEGDVVMEFDPAEQQFALEQALSELEEAEQEIRKREADIAVQLAQDKVTLLSAQFDVRRAELDVNVDEDLLAANDIKIRQLSLEEARRRLSQVEQDVKSRETTSKSGLAVLNERRSKSKLNAERAEQNIQTLVLTTPIAGVIVVRENRDAGGGVFFSGMSLPEWRTGDSTFAGRPMFDVFDPVGMEIRATVNEQERVNLAPNQAASVDLKSSAGHPRPATVSTVGSLGKTAAGPLRQFDVTLTLDAIDPSLKPGTTVAITAKGRQVEDVLSIPKHALFEKDGKSQVYARTGGGFELREVKVLYRNESRVAVEGLDEGTEVALVDPTRSPTAASGATTPAATAPAPGGGK